MRENNIQEVICRYDVASDILGVKSNKKFEYRETIEMDDGLLLDFDVDNVPVSLEILDASKRFNLPCEGLNNIVFFKMEVCIEDKSISLKAILGVLVDNVENIQDIESFTSNHNHYPNGISELALI